MLALRASSRPALRNFTRREKWIGLTHRLTQVVGRSCTTAQNRGLQSLTTRREPITSYRAAQHNRSVPFHTATKLASPPMASSTATGQGAAPVPRAADSPLVWIDCEMTGLDPDSEEILEIFCIITTGNLEVIDPEGFHAVVHWPEARLNKMDAWCTRTHGQSGLTAAVLASSTTPEQAADGLFQYVTKIVPEKRVALLAGNSVHADRAFLRQAPYDRVMEHLHYRILDVSSIKEAAKRWCPREVIARVPEKKGRHLAKDDILESIEEAKYYRDAIFRKEI